MPPEMTVNDLREWFKRASDCHYELHSTYEVDHDAKRSSLSISEVTFNQLDGEVDEFGNGYGTMEVTPQLTIEGPIKEFQFHGKCIERIWSESKSYGVMQRGVKLGIWKTFSLDNKLKAFVEYSEGKPTNHSLLVKSGNSCLIGNFWEHGNIQGKGIYLYPGFKYAISGDLIGGKMRNGQFAKVLGAQIHHSPYGVPQPILEFQTNYLPICYDPSTSLRISKTPLVPDPYEDLTVFVEASGTPGAGEGLFAKQNFQAGDLISLFNGLKIFKTGRITKISAESEDWSDYRLTVDKDVDIDITEDLVSLKTYCASHGHKACHSFEQKNAKFDNLFHPRFGEIMSIVALTNIPKNSEILVNYNYDLTLAPLWYKGLWQKFQTKRTSC